MNCPIHVTAFKRCNITESRRERCERANALAAELIMNKDERAVKLVISCLYSSWCCYRRAAGEHRLSANSRWHVAGRTWPADACMVSWVVWQSRPFTLYDDKVSSHRIVPQTCVSDGQ